MNANETIDHDDIYRIACHDRSWRAVSPVFIVVSVVTVDTAAAIVAIIVDLVPLLSSPILIFDWALKQVMNKPSVMGDNTN